MKCIIDHVDVKMPEKEQDLEWVVGVNSLTMLTGKTIKSFTSA